jgi:hypothetical protein
MQIIGQTNIVVLWSGEHAEIFRQAGWGRKQIKECLFQHARRTVADLKRAGRLPKPVLPEDETTWRHATFAPEDILMLRAGAAMGAFSTCLPGWGSRTHTKAVTIPVEGV